jgi:DNA modification methylase
MVERDEGTSSLMSVSLKSLSKSEQVEDTNMSDNYLANIQKLDACLADYYSAKLVVDKNLNRKLVSFQANKARTHYRWYKYKEAFSATLVEYLFRKYHVNKGEILDPFAGSGTSLFACSSLGYHAEGIEVLPVGQKIIEANIIARSQNKDNFIKRINYWISKKVWNKDGKYKEFEVLRITDGAYPKKTERMIGRFLFELDNEELGVREILLFALLCVVESISFTRKDGQYLRWDYRSGRREGKNTFNKGRIQSFDEAITRKLKDISADISKGNSKNDLFSSMEEEIETGNIDLLKGSCLDILPSRRSRNYTGIITSPPYCNRYDYTRTYALEHALLGVNEKELLFLRQAMLSCTVENKKKRLLSVNEEWQKGIDICEKQPLLQEILNYLDYKKEKKELNNSGIARMVRGYFYEMACVIQECYRTLKKNGLMFMVNDNVRYAGASISVDIILSRIAEDLGFTVEKILILPQGKGNSSQQMGKHGREALRKCVYIWKKGK